MQLAPRRPQPLGHIALAGLPHRQAVAGGDLREPGLAPWAALPLAPGAIRAWLSPPLAGGGLFLFVASRHARRGAAIVMWFA
jgi:hypothetical protein